MSAPTSSPLPAEIVVTGTGLVSPLGLTAEETWHGVLACRSVTEPPGALESPLAPGRDGPGRAGAAQIPDLPAAFMPGQPREVRALRAAMDGALAHAGLAPTIPYHPSRCGLILGTTLHGMRQGGRFFRTDDPAFLATFLAPSVMARAAAGLPFGGPALTTCSACSSGLSSIGLAVTLLRAGVVDLVLAGGYDPVSEYVYAGFDSLRLVAAGASRPFCRGRDGMKLGESYAVLALERGDDAARRGARPLASVRGIGESSDAHHLTQPHPAGEGALRAVRAALRSAGLRPADITLIAAHATGTPNNDAAEYAALSAAFGDDLPRAHAVAFKSHLGHTLGGAGAAELILSLFALREGVVPPTAGVTPDDLEFAVPLNTGVPLRSPVRATLNTSLGFGGANTCVVLGRASDQGAARSSSASALARAAPVAPGVGSGADIGLARTVSARDGGRPPNARPTANDDWRDARPTASDGGLDAHPGFLEPRDVFITGVGIILPGAIGNGAFRERLSRHPEPVRADTGPIDESLFAHLLNTRRVRRMSDYVKLTLAATAGACADAGIADLPAFAASSAAVLGTTHGSTGFCEAYYGQIVREGMGAANPALFAEGVPNAAAAQMSLMLGITGPCSAIIGSRTAGLEALWLAALRIADGTWDRAIVSAGEEYSAVVNRAYAHHGLHRPEGASLPFEGTGGFATGAGGVTVVLESAASVSARGAGVRGRVIAGAAAHAGPGARERVGAVRTVLRALPPTAAVLTSANGTFVDRLERLALGGVRGVGTVGGASGGPAPTVVSSIAGHLPELFSAGPLAALAAVLLTGRIPRLRAEVPWLRNHLLPASGDGAFSSVALLCTDYAGPVAGVAVDRGGG